MRAEKMYAAKYHSGNNKIVAIKTQMYVSTLHDEKYSATFDMW